MCVDIFTLLWALRESPGVGDAFCDLTFSCLVAATSVSFGSPDSPTRRSGARASDKSNRAASTHSHQCRRRGSSGCRKNKFLSVARLSHNTSFIRHLSRRRSSAPENSTQGTHPLNKWVSLPRQKFRSAQLSFILFFGFPSRAWPEKACSLRVLQAALAGERSDPRFFTQRRAS